jgi:peptidoglycan/LPS O-acetylase OafA/YrhL
MFGVLEALGVAVLLAAAVATAVPDRHLPVATAAVLVAGAVSVHVAGDRSWLGREVVGGKFPIVTYTGFALAGVAVVRSGRHLDRRWAASAAAAGLAATAALLVAGLAPARYPGDVAYAVPGLAGTAVLFGVGHMRWRPALGVVDRVVRRAAAHTLGIFIAHYVLYGGLRRYGLLGTFSGAVAVAVAAAVTVSLCLVAPRVPPLPWSPRTGARAPAARAARPAPAPPAPARP